MWNRRLRTRTDAPSTPGFRRSRLCLRRHAGGADGLSDRHHHLRPEPRVERLHGAVAAQHASGGGHRHERERRQAMGRLRQLRRRSRARVPGRPRDGGQRHESAAPGIARARRARLRRQGALAVRSQPADPDARRTDDLVRPPAPRLAARRLPGRLLLAGCQPVGPGGQHAGPDARQPQQAGHRQRDARRRSADRSVARGRHRVGMGGWRPRGGIRLLAGGPRRDQGGLGRQSRAGR